jgi:hypothetical protein
MTQTAFFQRIVNPCVTSMKHAITTISFIESIILSIYSVGGNENWFAISLFLKALKYIINQPLILLFGNHNP